MPDEVDKFLGDKQQLESRRQELIKEIQRRPEAQSSQAQRRSKTAGVGQGPTRRRVRALPPFSTPTATDPWDRTAPPSLS